MDEGVTNSYEAMKRELIEAGYHFTSLGEDWDYKAHWRVNSPDDWEYHHWVYRGAMDNSGDAICENEAIEKAYQHLQEKKHLAALEDFVKQVAESYKHDSDALEKLVDRARELVE